ncbi:hypothetical protein MQ572_002600 [Cronobacter sakazakii]|nr:hypothetical protein [Cronobacter sakazakii]
MKMTTTKDQIFAAMHGMTSAEYALEKARQELAKATAQHLEQHPELLQSSSVETPTKVTRISKSLGADSRPVVAHTTDHIDPEVLERAKAACRKLVADNPERYGNIIKKKGV